MSDAYSYDFDTDTNYAYGSTPNAGFDDVSFNEQNVPPVPNWSPPVQETRTNEVKKVNPPPPPVVKKPAESKKSKKPDNLVELEGIFAYKIFSIITVGELPFPFINPNYFKYVLHSGHWIIIPTSFFEFVLLWAVLFINFVANWFYLAGAIESTWQVAPYTALRIIWAFLSICLVPVMILTKYCVIYRACIESNLLIKAPLYVTFVILATISLLYYFLMGFGLTGSGFFTGLTLFVKGFFPINIFVLIVGALELIVGLVWIPLIVCCIIEIGGMIRNFWLYRKAQIAKNAANATANAV